MEVEILQQHPQYEVYKSSGSYGRRLGWGKRPVLLLIDVCVAYWKAGSPLDLTHNPSGAASPKSMQRLVAAARRGGTPVVWAQVRYTHPQMQDSGVQGKKSKTLTAWQDGDTRGLDAWMPGLEAQPEDTVVLKRNPSAFFGTTSATELHLLGADSMVLCGVSTSGCVRATAADALCAGYKALVCISLRVNRRATDSDQVVPSACGDRSDVIQQQALFDIDNHFGDVVSEEEAMEKLSEGWL